MNGQPDVVTLDGSLGEGGGQILRTALGLSLATGTPFRITNIRGRRPQPGLRRQHLTAVQAAARVGRAEIDGAALGSRDLFFSPQGVQAGEFDVDVGTAGSTTLVLQTVLPALLTAGAASSVTLHGGTHNPWAPPLDFVAQTFLPLVNRMGPRVTLRLDRYGFYPAGGGKIRAVVQPAARLRPLQLMTRGSIRRRTARALIAQLPAQIAERELRVVKHALQWRARELVVEPVASAGPGNVLLAEIHMEALTEVFTAFGRKGVRAESVAGELVADVQRYLASDAPAGEHLADQLLVPLALAGGGSFRTLPLTPHARTNIEVIRAFLAVGITERADGRSVVVEVDAAGREAYGTGA